MLLEILGEVGGAKALATIGAAVKAVADEHKLKMPKIAMPLRVMVTGETQTPSIDATLELIGREECLERMRRELARESHRLLDRYRRGEDVPPADCALERALGALPQRPPAGLPAAMPPSVTAGSPQTRRW